MRTAILGAGESGRGAALLAKKLGHDIWLSEKGSLNEQARQELLTNAIPFEEGEHSMEQLLRADQVIKSPGIPDQLPMIQQIRAKGIPVISEIEFAGRHTDAELVAITGTNGKTTTTLLTYHLLREAGREVVLGGNVGRSFARLVAGGDFPLAVLELSSFQLDGIVHFRSRVAALLNITPDHLDRYDYELANYIAAKFRITMNQGPEDLFFYWQEDDNIRSYLHRREGRARLRPLSSGQMQGKLIQVDGQQLSLEGSALYGRHNAMNALFAAYMARALGITPEQVQRDLQTFRNHPHRMERVAVWQEVEYINDSKATNVDAAYYALEAMQRPVIWIAGGTDKGNDYSALLPLVRRKVKALVCLGADNSKIKAAFEGEVPQLTETTNAADAVAAAQQYAEPGDVVLLAPACASFDLFNNYEDRGDQFRRAVLDLKQNY
jgi:UDP-N-acetylmuramoylalanine--D-glutamate ligase